MGAVANRKFLTVKKLSKIFSSENVRLKMPNLGLKTSILREILEEKLGVEHP